MDELDQPADAPAPAPQEYKLPGDDVARVFDRANPQTPEQLQEIVTLIRSVGGYTKALRLRSAAFHRPARHHGTGCAGYLVSERTGSAGECRNCRRGNA
jgi:hypothetical protein